MAFQGRRSNKKLHIVRFRRSSYEEYAVSELYPLRFEPIFRQYIWGGRRLGEVLNKPIGQGEDFAESWEVVDHGEDQSVVSHGPLAGQTLRQIASSHGDELFGRHAPQAQFPLLFKYLDCNRNLSVQVHPNDEQAARLDPPDLGKTEAWLILDAKPGSFVYTGLKPGFDLTAVKREVSAGRADMCLHKFEPQPGDCIFIPTGTVHALGQGLLVAEIQQASDTTFRLFDWNRLGADGQPRPLHISESLAVIDYQRGPVGPQEVREIESSQQQTVERLVECDKFILDRRKVSGDTNIGGDDRFHIISVITGEATLADDPAEKPLTLGQTALIPASVTAKLRPANDGTVLIDAYLP